MDIIDVLKTRRSYKIPFDKKQVNRALVEGCIKIAQWAPSAHNSQPWRYIILDKMELRIKLIDEMNEKLRRDLRNDGKSDKFIKNEVNKTREQILTAPILILSCMDTAVLDEYKDREREDNEFILGVSSVASSITYLLISFQKYNLVACWYSAPLFAREIVSKILELPDNFYPLAFITVGYPLDKEIQPPSRQPLNKILFYNSNFSKQ